MNHRDQFGPFKRRFWAALIVGMLALAVWSVASNPPWKGQPVEPAGSSLSFQNRFELSQEGCQARGQLRERRPEEPNVVVHCCEGCR